jgi:hypothetical protein
MIISFQTIIKTIKLNFMPYEKLSLAEERKLIIIENFIDYYTSDEKQREDLKELAFGYVIEDHVNELDDLLPTKRIIQYW